MIQECDAFKKNADLIIRKAFVRLCCVLPLDTGFLAGGVAVSFQGRNDHC